MNQDMFNDFVKTVEPYVKAYGAINLSMTFGGKFVNITSNYVKGLIQRQYYDIDEIFNEIDNENIKVGSIIKTSGILLRYGQVFKPYTHVNGMFSNCAKGEEKEIYRAGRRVVQCSMEMTSKVFQPPVQKIPPCNGIACAFIYDSRFKGFIHDSNRNQDELKEKPLIVDKFSKPIIVLYDITKQEKFINREVDLRCRVIKIPKELISSLNGIFDNTIREICSNFFRPYNENTNFICLSLLDSECGIEEISKIESIETIKAPLYVEGHIEGLRKLTASEAQELIQSILPNLPQKLDPNFPLKVGTFTNNIGIPFLSIDNINVVYREPEIVGFYCDTELFKPENYEKNIKLFSNFVNNFAIDYKNITRKLLGEKMGLELNFLFDYEKQYIFDKRGVLSSTFAKNLYDIDESSRYVQDWLKINRSEV
ncbi:hypothetical protein CPJCM30710_19820 [Clostridium polyendosporum]|uniref:Uncharacterized protein n=1 Tax=Clostridium polyendosporum TaxID=69208 RepID=A0A919RZR8_9CLOT|nr:hypothetical protein [Clostridium polyendosporum]GIM29316.1 hypothetical protein CPJCM30710_19820 [Clostridium polyendosporum]